MKPNNKRELVLDVETTGFYFENDDRIVEIGIVEMINRIPTGVTFHVYMDPRIEVPEGAYKIHGWTREDLIAQSGGKGFEHIAKDLISFINGDDLIIHNASFDMGFLDMELNRIGMPSLSSQCSVFDTLIFARRLFPGKKNTLDMLCKRYGIDNSNRELHGALLDSQLLAEVYIALTRNQASLSLNQDTSEISDVIDKSAISERLSFHGLESLPVIELDEQESQNHIQIARKLQSKYEDKSKAPWSEMCP